MSSGSWTVNEIRLGAMLTPRVSMLNHRWRGG
jgi:hypothetical protein